MAKESEKEPKNQEELKNYHGTQLLEKEFYVMMNLEREIGEIPHLKEFDFERNGFVSQDGHVKDLAIINENLNHLPELIGDLEELENLLLDFNNISELPRSVSKLDKLEYVSLYENPLKKPGVFPKRVNYLQSLIACGLDQIVKSINSFNFRKDLNLMLQEGIMEDPLAFMELFYEKYFKNPPINDKYFLIEVLSALKRTFYIIKEYNKKDEIYAGDFYRVEGLYQYLHDHIWIYLKYQISKSKWEIQEKEISNDEMLEYNGIHLYRDECIAMIELERIIGEKIPLFEEEEDDKDLYFYEEGCFYFHDICRFGYVESDGHVIKLGISKKWMEYVPESIGYLKELIVLSLSEIKLKFLPKTIGKLENLKLLEICQNDLKELPEEIGNLVKLEDLWIMDNKLESLPDSLIYLKKLGNISLIGNPPPFNLGRTLPNNIKKILAQIKCTITDIEGIEFFDDIVDLE